MGNRFDYSYRFEGSAKKIAKARAAIEKFQAAHAEYSGCGSYDFSFDIEVELSGALTWNCYAGHNMDEFEKILTRLSQAGCLRIWAYWGSDDGFWESRLDLFENKTRRFVDKWDAPIGLEAALAIHRLSESSTAEDLLILIDSFNLAVSVGWDEGDEDDCWKFNSRDVAEFLADTIGKAVVHNFYLMNEELSLKALLGMKTSLLKVREHRIEVPSSLSPKGDGVDGLLATIEALEIALEATTAAPAAANAQNIRL